MTESPETRSARRDEKVFPPIRQDHAQAIGDVVTQWSMVEEAVAFTAGSLLGVEGDAAYAVTAELSSAAKFALVRSLFTATRNQSWIDDWDNVEPEFRRLQGARNDVVHGVWQVVGDTHWLNRVTARGEIVRRHGEYSTAQVRKDVEDVRNLLDQLDWFNSAILPQANAALRSGWLKPRLVPGQGKRARDQAESKRLKKLRKDEFDLRSRQAEARIADACKK